MRVMPLLTTYYFAAMDGWSCELPTASFRRPREHLCLCLPANDHEPSHTNNRLTLQGFPPYNSSMMVHQDSPVYTPRGLTVDLRTGRVAPGILRGCGTCCAHAGL